MVAVGTPDLKEVWFGPNSSLYWRSRLTIPASKNGPRKFQVSGNAVWFQPICPLLTVLFSRLTLS